MPFLFCVEAYVATLLVLKCYVITVNYIYVRIKLSFNLFFLQYAQPTSIWRDHNPSIHLVNRIIIEVSHILSDYTYFV